MIAIKAAKYIRHFSDFIENHLNSHTEIFTGDLYFCLNHYFFLKEQCLFLGHKNTRRKITETHTIYTVLISTKMTKHKPIWTKSVRAIDNHKNYLQKDIIFPSHSYSLFGTYLSQILKHKITLRFSPEKIKFWENLD